MTIIFVHVPKTGGTSLEQIMQAQYGERHHHIANYGRREPFWDMSESEQNRFRSIAGHFSFGLHTHFNGDVHYISLVRRPLPRIRSLYRYIRRRKMNPLHPYAAKLSFGDWLTSDIADLDNGMTRMFAGRMQFGTHLPGRQVSEVDYKIAVQNLVSFDYVGRTEEMETAVSVLAKRFGWRVRSIPHLLDSDESKEDSALDLTLDNVQLAAFRQANQWDYLLYDHIVKRF